VLTRYIDRIAFANDASVYRLIPRAVVLPETIDEVQALLRLGRQHKVPLTFRAAGTSLSGQAITDGILAVLSRKWSGLEVLDEGKRIRVQPGVIGGHVNQRLKGYQTKLGPDPASINACMMGGILANNSSGMCCGVERNAYHTLDSMAFVLPDGLFIDSADPDAHEQLAAGAPVLVRGLTELKRRIEADPELSRKIRSKYRMKNTTGYSLNAFLDFARPLDILCHLMIGSEGTLGFIAHAVLHTIPDLPWKYTGLLFFDDVPHACSSIRPLRESGAEALELMDHASLRAIEREPGVPRTIRTLRSGSAALLVEYQCRTEEELNERQRECERLLPALRLSAPADFTLDSERQAALWRVRKGLIPSVGAMRARGTAFIIEDVVFPLATLAQGVAELQGLFAEYDYRDAIVFGHAKDGNLHFVLTQTFAQAEDIARYDGFMHALADLVAGRHGGALKAEHGTGRNMAPFVAVEWGGAALETMRELKRLIDPDGLLNPGVILNDAADAHLTHLKDLPTVEGEVDQCIECGFCERMCPSRDLTLAPRQRIVVRREMARLRGRDPHDPRLRELERDFDYSGLETCAADGLCALACPVSIDTGLLVKRLRREAHSALRQELALQLALRFDWVERAARLALKTGHATRAIVGDRITSRLVDAARVVFGRGLPRWDPALPHAARGALPTTRGSHASAVYFPSCVSRILGSSAQGDTQPPLTRVITRVAERGGHPVSIPEEIGGCCCGMAFESKGYRRAFVVALERTIDVLWEASNAGALPVVVDTSPCAYTLKQGDPELSPRSRERHGRLRVLDGIEFAATELLPDLPRRRSIDRVLLHPVCSVHKMNLVGALEAVARACAFTVEIPPSAGCCGFAGDRGFRFPELSEAALRRQVEEASGTEYGGYYCSSRTCEIGLERATGKPFRSFWYLLDEATR
jgi:D-lactate dehydrogenase